MVATTRKKTPTTTAAPGPLTVGSIIDHLWTIREEKRVMTAQLKEVETRLSSVETMLMNRLETEGMDKATGRKASVSVSTNVIADVQDWDAFWKYIISKKYTHMLQKRVSEPAYRELLEKGVKVPGVVPFTKRTLNLRTVDSVS